MQLAGLSVVEVAGSVAGGWTAKLFAGLGARVVKVVPSAGDPLVAVGTPWRSGSTVTAYLDAGKEVVGQGEAAALVATADVVIESSAPEPLRPWRDDGIPTSAVRVLLSPFGLEGPYAGYRSTSLTDEAVSGHALLTGDPGREPLSGPGLQSSYAAGGFAFTGAMAALWSRLTTGRGQRVEVSHFEAMVALHQFTLVKYTHGGQVLRRLGNRYAGPGHPIGSYECADGWVSVSAPNGAMARAALRATGNGDLLDEHPIADLMVDGALIDQRLRPWIRARPVDDVVAAFQAARVPVAPTRTMLELLDDEHFSARGFWSRIDGLQHPGRPFRIVDASAPTPVSAVATPRPRPAADGPPLAGVRVLDLSRVWAGPLAARILAELGADVVMVEAPMARGPRRMPDSFARSTALFPENVAGERPWNRNGFQNEYARNKRSLTLDITTAAGRSALERLVARADVLVENYSARVMPQLGLGEERLHECNPSLVYVTMPGYGRSGPCRDWLAYGNVIDAHGGMTSITGYDGGEPWKSGIAWPDAVAGVHAAGAAIAALWPGAGGDLRPGRTVEVAQIETVIATLGHELLEAQARGRDREPRGNRDPGVAPQGVYPCRGEDRWIAISVTDERSWRGLCSVVPLGAELSDLPFGARRARHDEIDRRLADHTSGQDAVDLFHRLQGAGVAAAPVLDAPGLLADPHLTARRFFVTVEHPEARSHPTNRLPIRLSETPAAPPSRAPLFGEHAREVLAGEANLTEGEIAGLVAAGIVVDAPPK